MSPEPKGAHLVGSLPVASAEEAFKEAAKLLSGKLSMIPDGETGVRNQFVRWQIDVFPKEILKPHFRNMHDSGTHPKHAAPVHYADHEATPSDHKGHFDHEKIELGSTEYDDAAVQSYETFVKLREEGVIPKDVRFQVCIPGVWGAILPHVERHYYEAVFPLYRQRLVEAVERMQKQIPAKDLAIQIDSGVEMGILEHAAGTHGADLFKLHIEGDPMPKVLKSLTDVVRSIKSEVPVGYHLGYGSRGGKHFAEPEDMTLMVKVANALSNELGSTRTIEWFHMPVFKDRTNSEFYEALKGLHVGDAKLFLGLVHAHDLDGTKERIEAARKVYGGSFGVGAPFGLGRSSKEDAESFLEIMSEVTQPL